MFAKLYNETDYGQILVKIDSGDEGPEVRFFFEPENLGVCSIALKFEDNGTDEAWDKAENAFENVDEATASAMVKQVVDKLTAL